MGLTVDLFYERYRNYITTSIFPVVLDGFENSSLTLWEKHRLRVFENRMMRRILGSKRVEVTV
jgi:hypothetical protein